MKLPGKIRVIVFLTLFFFVFSINAAYPAEPEAVKLADGVYAFIGVDGGTNSAFVVTSDGVIVVDTQGPKRLALLLKKDIKDVTERPLIYAVNTHYHGDHTFGNQYFKEAREIIAHENTRSLMVLNDAPHRERFKKLFGPESLEGFTLTPPTMTFTDRMILRSGGRTLVLTAAEPAHTGGDIYVYLPEEKIVFTGDLLFKGRLPILSDGDTEGCINALDELLRLDARVYVPGHGTLADKQDVRAYRDYLADLRAEVKRLMDMGRTLEEVKKGISLPKYKGYLKYNEWLPANAEKVYTEFINKKIQPGLNITK